MIYIYLVSIQEYYTTDACCCCCRFFVPATLKHSNKFRDRTNAIRHRPNDNNGDSRCEQPSGDNQISIDNYQNDWFATPALLIAFVLYVTYSGGKLWKCKLNDVRSVHGFWEESCAGILFVDPIHEKDRHCQAYRNVHRPGVSLYSRQESMRYYGIPLEPGSFTPKLLSSKIQKQISDTKYTGDEEDI